MSSSVDAQCGVVGKRQVGLQAREGVVSVTWVPHCPRPVALPVSRASSFLTTSPLLGLLHTRTSTGPSLLLEQSRTPDGGLAVGRSQPPRLLWRPPARFHSGQRARSRLHLTALFSGCFCVSFRPRLPQCFWVPASWPPW